MRLSPLLTLVIAALSLSGCVSLDRLESPESAYSGYATQPKLLQIPADLSAVVSSEQFVLPSVDASASKKRDAATKKQ